MAKEKTNDEFLDEIFGTGDKQVEEKPAKVEPKKPVAKKTVKKETVKEESKKSNPVKKPAKAKVEPIVDEPTTKISAPVLKGNPEIAVVDLNKIIESDNQRKFYDENNLKSLSDSMSENGLIVPIILRPLKDGNYQLIAGSRRLRSAKKLNWKGIKAIIEPTKDDEFAVHQLIENIDRDDLSAIEIALTLQDMIKNKVFANQKEAAKKLGKSAVWVTEKLRLLKLPQWLQDEVVNRTIPDYIAYSISRLTDEDDMRKIFKSYVANELSAKQITDKVNLMLEAKGLKKESKNPVKAEKAKENKKAQKKLEYTASDDNDDSDDVDGFFDTPAKSSSESYSFTQSGMPENVSVSVSETSAVITIEHSFLNDDLSLKSVLRYFSDNYKAFINGAAKMNVEKFGDK